MKLQKREKYALISLSCCGIAFILALVAFNFTQILAWIVHNGLLFKVIVGISILILFELPKLLPRKLRDAWKYSEIACRSVQKALNCLQLSRRM